MAVFTFSPFGYDGDLIAVEVELRKGLPVVDVKGMVDGTIKGSRERIKSAVANSGFEFPGERVLINLSPVELKKEGSGFDFAIALALLATQKGIDIPSVLVMGGLESDGSVNPARAVVSASETAAVNGIKHAIVPKANVEEAKEIENVFGMENLKEAFEWLCGKKRGAGFLEDEADEGISFCKDYEKTIKCSKKIRDALVVAAAGRHNILLYGNPGCGKSLLLRNFRYIVPNLTKEERKAVERIYSIAGLYSGPLREAPFRSLHKTATIEGVCGGGVDCRPGEISLAHNGVLFLDEVAEFLSTVLQMLQVPLEKGSITLGKAGRITIYPANFQLVMAANPCSCGYFGSGEKLCICSARAIDMYWKKFSEPLLDRIDIVLHVGDEEDVQEWSVDEIRKQVAKAVGIQRIRGKRNAKLSAEEIGRLAKHIGKDLDLPQKVMDRLRGVALTIADLQDRDVSEDDFNKALELRKSIALKSLLDFTANFP